MKRNSLVISVNSKFSSKIFSGEKNVEFRKKWVVNPIHRLFIYETSPVKKIVGYAAVKSVVNATPEELWEKFGEFGGGVSKSEFFVYFKGKQSGFAVVLSDVVRFECSIDPCLVFKKFVAPQSYLYIDAIVEKKMIDFLEGVSPK